MKKETGVVITGAAGFIGSNLCRALTGRNIRVMGMDNLVTGNKKNLEEIQHSEQFSFLERDVSNPQSWKDIQAPIIIHLASHKIPRYGGSITTLRENEKMIHAVLEKCRNDHSHLIFASTSEIYGKNPSLPYQETSDSVLGHSGISRWAYAVSKIYAEHLLHAYAESYQLTYTIFRLFGCYGPGQQLSWTGGPQSEFISAALRNEPMKIHGNGLQMRSFLFVDDAVDGITRMLLNPAAKNRVYNLCDDPHNEISILDLAKKIWTMIRQDEFRCEWVPYSEFVHYEEVMRRTGFFSRAEAELGFQPSVSLHQGLEKTIAWQRMAMKL